MIDLTYPLKREDIGTFHGHDGTHFDIMDKTFPLDYTVRKAVCFSVKGLREIGIEDVDLSKVRKGMAVLFCSSFMEEAPYRSEAYRHEHPELSHELIDELLKREVSLIGIDFEGVRRGKEHTPADQKCADQGCFIIENMVNLEELIGKKDITLYTFPVSISHMTGIPCRVTAEVRDRDPLSVLGRRVKVKMDRPIGTIHPKHPDIVYPINYGYIEGLVSEDGEEQDAYILGPKEPLTEYEGRVIAVIHRYDDVEDKWVVSDKKYTKEEIEEMTRFQEQFYHSEILLK
ncbi:MAG: cyclase family protein [Erysipelotrichaceae bacterium]|nr:cyclase family protein [Erysipelotrichaceae bacterium]